MQERLLPWFNNILKNRGISESGDEMVNIYTINIRITIVSDKKCIEIIF